MTTCYIIFSSPPSYTKQAYLGVLVLFCLSFTFFFWTWKVVVRLTYYIYISALE